jgi:hypothetical protein
MRGLGARLRAWGPLLFAGIVVLQGSHVVEHLAQVYQKFGLGFNEAHGIAGAAVDREVVHLAYNSALLAGLVAVLLALGVAQRWRAAREPWMVALVGAAGLQAYHFVEHVVKFQQFLALGRNDTPGLLGNVVPGILLHMAFNLAVFAPMLLAYVLWRRGRAASPASLRAPAPPVADAR